MKKLICIDLDGTLTTESTWETINSTLGLSPDEDQLLFDEYKKGTLSYSAWIEVIIDQYKTHGLIKKEVLEAIPQIVPIRDGAQSLIDTAKEKGYDILLLSGSVDTIVKGYAEMFGVAYWKATNEVVYDEQEHLVGIDSLGDEAPAKLALLTDFCEKYDYALPEVISIGDGGNDIEIFKVTKGILLGVHEELVKVAWRQVGRLEEIKECL